MQYSINKLAKLAGVSVRTLHYYDQIGLLKAGRVAENGYRWYEGKELIRLQQILFFRELDFPLLEIKRILDAPDFQITTALVDQKKLIELKRKRLAGLIKTIDKTIQNLNNKTTMDDKDLYNGFSEEEMKKFSEEAKQRWGNTEAYKQSTARVAKMSKDDTAAIQKENNELMKEIAANMAKGPQSPEIQKLIAQHYNNLRHFYEPNLEMYRGLGQMYVNDERFGKYFEKYAPDLARFMRDAIANYCDSQTKKQD